MAFDMTKLSAAQLSAMAAWTPDQIKALGDSLSSRTSRRNELLSKARLAAKDQWKHITLHRRIDVDFEDMCHDFFSRLKIDDECVKNSDIVLVIDFKMSRNIDSTPNVLAKQTGSQTEFFYQYLWEIHEYDDWKMKNAQFMLMFPKTALENHETLSNVQFVANDMRELFDGIMENDKDVGDYYETRRLAAIDQASEETKETPKP